MGGSSPIFFLSHAIVEFAKMQLQMDPASASFDTWGVILPVPLVTWYSRLVFYIIIFDI